MSAHTATFALFTLATLALMTGCSPAESEDAATAKGQEEEPIEVAADGKADSFRTPTEQGELTFGLEHGASMSDDAIFHAWTFTLTAEATISLRTGISAQNLDTVMYLYRRDEGTSRWGRYLKKNDDHQENIWSQIELEGAEAGEYRVIVKPFKSALRGRFSLEAECKGAGCPAGFEPLMCQGEERAGSSGFSPECGATFHDILTTPEVAVSPADIACVEERARDAYVNFWDEIVGFEDAFGGESSEDILIDSTTVLGDRGVLLSLSMGGDEDSVDLLFDHDGQLLYLFHHEQSPTVMWSCPASASTSDVLEDEDCASMASAALHRKASEVTSDQGTLDQSELDELTLVAIAHATERLDLAKDEPFFRSSYTNSDFMKVVELTVGDSTFTVVDNFSAPILLSIQDGEGVRFICD